MARQLDVAHDADVGRNRKGVIAVAKALVFLAEQGIPLRGHREVPQDRKVDPEAACDDDEASAADGNPGNFIALRELLIAHGDIDLQIHDAKASAHATYYSPQIQNELLCLAAVLKLAPALEELRQAAFFSLMIDEAADSASVEQLAFVYRFVDKAFNIQEIFVEFVALEHADGASLAAAVVKHCESNHLDLRRARGIWFVQLHHQFLVLTF